MKKQIIQPNQITYICLIKSIINLKDIKKGNEIYNEIINSKIYLDINLLNALINMFSEIGDNLKSLQLFEEMKKQGIKPDQITYICLLKGITNIGDIELGEKLIKKFIRMELK
jgi:pentatricopeptide repeat protein